MPNLSKRKGIITKKLQKGRNHERYGTDTKKKRKGTETERKNHLTKNCIGNNNITIWYAEKSNKRLQKGKERHVCIAYRLCTAIVRKWHYTISFLCYMFIL